MPSFAPRRRNRLLKIKFNPPLPTVQREAAEKLIYARICKNSVLYEKRFWKDENFSMVSDVTSHFYFHSTQNQAGKEGILTSYADRRKGGHSRVAIRRTKNENHHKRSKRF